MEALFKNCARFTNCKAKQTDNAKYIDIVMLMYNLIEYSLNYSKKSERSWQYYRDEPALTNAGALDTFPDNSALFKFKQKITGKIRNDDKWWWGTLEMPLIDSETNLILTWSANCVIPDATANQATKFAITDTKPYVSIFTLWIQDKSKLLQQLKSGFKHTSYRNKCQSKIATQSAPNQYLNDLIDPSFQGVNRLFVLGFNVNDSRIGKSRYYFPTAKEEYNVMIDGKNFFDQPT